jgi:hypothetical protein
MPRLRQKGTGVVVSVDESTASTLGAGWDPADEPPPEKPAPKRSPRRKPADSK